MFVFFPYLEYEGEDKVSQNLEMNESPPVWNNVD